MSLERLQQLVTKAAKAVYDNEKFVTGVLAVRADKLAQQFPTDQTVVNMAGFLTKRAMKESFITRFELQDAYQRLYTNNNKFVGCFAQELGAVEAVKSNVMTRDAQEGSLTNEAFEKLADPVLVGALNSAFDKTIPYRPFSEKLAKDAEKGCLYSLKTLDLEAKKVATVAGREDLIICQASYDTPKGQSHVLIPVEIKNSKALLPTIFLGQEGFLNLEAASLQDHLLKTAGKSYKVDVEQLLEVLASAKNGTPEPLSEVELIVIRANAAKETPSTHSVNNILKQAIDNPIPDVQETRYEQPQEVQDFAKRLTSAAGVAEFILGKKAVESGRNMIKFALDKFGYDKSQISVADNDKETIFYAVAVDNKVGFRVPVKVANGKAQLPEFIVSEAGVSEFSKEGISELLAIGTVGTQEMVKASAMYGLKASELVEQLRQAIKEGNYTKAEDALTILRTAGDQKAYNVGYELYSAWLSGKIEKTASSCSMQIKTANSQHILCGHTNLPLHKVYQDKHGDCRPAYRKDMSETSEGGSFLHSRIYLG